jgi:nucleoside-diphosphate-sugar epimerase
VTTDRRELMAPSTATLQDAPILVTGATGLIGRHLVRALLDCRADVVAVVRPGRERLLPPGARAMVWDLRDDHPRSRLPRQLSAVVHLAAPRDRSSSSNAMVGAHIRLTVDAAARLFEAARVRDVAHVISLSTIAVLAPRAGGRDRHFVTPPTHPYALVKRWGEDLAVNLRPHVRCVTIVRPGPVYGPGQSPYGLIPRFAASLRRRQPIHIAAPRGRLVSPVFVDDVVDLLVAALARPGRHATWNVGGPTAHREQELIEDLGRRLGVRPRIATDRAQRPARFDIDNTAVDRRFPGRLRTPWAVGMSKTWPRLRTR